MTTKPPSRASLFKTLAVLGLTVLFLVFWKQQTDFSRMSRDYSRLLKEHEQLQQDFASARAQPVRPKTAPTSVPIETPKDSGAVQSKGQPTRPEPNRLALNGTEVHPIPGGLAATLRFSPTQPRPMGHLTLVIRMPKNSDAKILNLATVGSPTNTEFSNEVSEDGKSAFFQGELGDETNVQFALSISGSATVAVRGNCGIKPFELAIQPSGARVLAKSLR